MVKSTTSLQTNKSDGYVRFLEGNILKKIFETKILKRRVWKLWEPTADGRDGISNDLYKFRINDKNTTLHHKNGSKVKMPTPNINGKWRGL